MAPPLLSTFGSGSIRGYGFTRRGGTTMYTVGDVTVGNPGGGTLIEISMDTNAQPYTTLLNLPVGSTIIATLSGGNATVVTTSAGVDNSFPGFFYRVTFYNVTGYSGPIDSGTVIYV